MSYRAADHLRTASAELMAALRICVAKPQAIQAALQSVQTALSQEEKALVPGYRVEGSFQVRDAEGERVVVFSPTIRLESDDPRVLRFAEGPGDDPKSRLEEILAMRPREAEVVGVDDLGQGGTDGLAA